MNVFVINGSPKGMRSNTYRVSNAFLEGMGQIQKRECCVCQMEIKPCRGCFACWNQTPGTCVIRDDMASVIENMLWADVILWSFPLYYFSIPGPLKNLMDRQLPMSLPFMDSESEAGGHPSRYDMRKKRHVVISTCGFYTAEGNYGGVTAVFDHLCGIGNYTGIYCGQGELFRVPELNGRTEAYLRDVRKAGQEFAAGGISRETQMQLKQLLFPREVFEAMADASWGVEENGEKTEETLTFTKQMAALYNKNAYPGKDLVLEMVYTDVNRRYQIILGKEGSHVLTENFREMTTRIETPYALWKAIAAGEITGQEALAQQKYRVTGDFSLMIHWDAYFGPEDPEEKTRQHYPKTNMNILLIPWIAFWIAVPVWGKTGAMIAAIVMALSTSIFSKNRRTVYDHISIGIVSLCELAVVWGLEPQIVIPISYFLFGTMWTISCFCKIPLTAHYSMNDYGGDSAMTNPLFLKTNRILTACWGVLYLISALWTYFLMTTPLAPYTGAVNSVMPMLMGLFTLWFQKWYPAKVARG